MTNTSDLSGNELTIPTIPLSKFDIKSKIQHTHSQLRYSVHMEKDEHMDRGKRIIQLRNAKNWSRVDLSEASGVGYDRLNKIEHNKTGVPRGTTMDSIAKALGVSVHYLETGKDEPCPTPSEPHTATSSVVLADPIGRNSSGDITNVTNQAWKLAEKAEERIYGKGKGSMDFMLDTYELIYKRLMRNKVEMD